MDGRISSKFLHPGFGYGGSCLPKDIKAAANIGDLYGVDMSLIKEVSRANEAQKSRLVEKIKKHTGPLSGKTIAVLGLAFKTETDDVRESPTITIVENLLAESATIKAHDPKAISNFKKLFQEGIHYFDDEFDTVEGADAVVICTDWNEYRNLDLKKMKKHMKGTILIDGRNVLDMEEAKSRGFVYEGVGRR